MASVKLKGEFLGVHFSQQVVLPEGMTEDEFKVLIASGNEVTSEAPPSSRTRTRNPMALFKAESPEETRARIDKHNGTVGWTDEQRAAEAEATQRRLTTTPETLALEEIQSVTTRAQAKAAGDLCMAKASASFSKGIDNQFYSRTTVSDLRYDQATYWQTRALSFYQLATLLP